MVSWVSQLVWLTINITQQDYYCESTNTQQWWYCAPSIIEALQGYSIQGAHNNATACKPCKVDLQGDANFSCTQRLPSQHTSSW